MHKEFRLTKDGSHTIAIPEMGVTYHSTFGAIRESQHVFIGLGFNYILETANREDVLNIFEMGFGTGLNALLTLIEAEKNKQQVVYEAVELYPLEIEFVASLNYCKNLERVDLEKTFLALHSCEWEKEVRLTKYFIIRKHNQALQQFNTGEAAQLVYFDAFDPNTQPELWTIEIFRKIFSMMQTPSVLVTYCSKGSVRRAMKGAGLKVKKIPGPPGKWEVVRAAKG